MILTLVIHFSKNASLAITSKRGESRLISYFMTSTFGMQGIKTVCDSDLEEIAI